VRRPADPAGRRATLAPGAASSRAPAPGRPVGWLLTVPRPSALGPQWVGPERHCTEPALCGGKAGAATVKQAGVPDAGASRYTLNLVACKSHEVS